MTAVHIVGLYLPNPAWHEDWNIPDGGVPFAIHEGTGHYSAWILSSCISCTGTIRLFDWERTMDLRQKRYAIRCDGCGYVDKITIYPRQGRSTMGLLLSEWYAIVVGTAHSMLALGNQENFPTYGICMPTRLPLGGDMLERVNSLLAASPDSLMPNRSGVDTLWLPWWHQLGELAVSHIVGPRENALMQCFSGSLNLLESLEKTVQAKIDEAAQQAKSASGFLHPRSR